TNDTIQPLRGFLTAGDRPTASPEARARSLARRHRPTARRVVLPVNRTIPPEAAGRWSLVADLVPTDVDLENVAPSVSSREREGMRATALVNQFLERFGIVTREAVQSEGIPGGFSGVYSVLKAMEDAGLVRRGYFVAGLGATQFALPAAVDRLRTLRET